MVEERWKRIQDLFERASDLPAEEREAFLHAETGGDDALIREVLELVAADNEASRFLEDGAIQEAGLGAVGDAVAGASEKGHWVGRQFGPYTATRELGRGGMGVVLLGERSDGRYTGQVAIKVVHSALMHGDLVERFRTEGQILADMDHPHVARLLDAGDTDDGLSYLVMEYVDGPRIDTYADNELLDVSARLDLFRKVLDGVDYAHARGVVHRDLKPSNILVTSDGRPKLVDFGIAKLLEPTAPDALALTRTTTRMMTPEYASPEQVRGLPVDATSDVYSLGVVLYRLLTGRAPYELPPTQPRDAERIICEETPQRPSTAITRTVPATETTVPVVNPEILARNRGSTLDRLQRALRGDLDTIVLKALAKEPAERYATAGAFGDDIDRHLAGQPIRAREPSFAYRATKFVRRRRVTIGVVGLVLAGLGVAGWQATVAARERATAASNTEELTELIAAVTRNLNLGQREEQGGTAAREAQITAALQSLQNLTDQMEGEPDASFLYQLSSAYREIGTVQGHFFSANLGKTEEATANLIRAMELAERVVELEPNSPRGHNALAQLQAMVGDQHLGTNNEAGAIEMYLKSLATLEEVRERFPDNERVLDGLGATYSRVGAIYERAGDLEKAIEFGQKAHDAELEYARVTPNNDRRTALQDVSNSKGVMAGRLMATGRTDEALEMSRLALQLADSLVSDEPTVRSREMQAGLRRAHASMLLTMGQPAEALEYATLALESVRDMRSSDPQNVQYLQETVLNTLAASAALLNLNRPSEALALTDTALVIATPMAEQRFAFWGLATAEILRLQGYALSDLERFDEADEKLGEVFDIHGRLSEIGGGINGAAYHTKTIAAAYSSLAKHQLQASRREGPARCAAAAMSADSSHAIWSRAAESGFVTEGEQLLWDLEQARIPYALCRS